MLWRNAEAGAAPITELIFSTEMKLSRNLKADSDSDSGFTFKTGKYWTEGCAFQFVAVKINKTGGLEYSSLTLCHIEEVKRSGLLFAHQWEDSSLLIHNRSGRNEWRHRVLSDWLLFKVSSSIWSTRLKQENSSKSTTLGSDIKPWSLQETGKTGWLQDVEAVSVFGFYK